MGRGGIEVILPTHHQPVSRLPQSTMSGVVRVFVGSRFRIPDSVRRSNRHLLCRGGARRSSQLQITSCTSVAGQITRCSGSMRPKAISSVSCWRAESTCGSHLGRVLQVVSRVQRLARGHALFGVLGDKKGAMVRLMPGEGAQHLRRSSSSTRTTSRSFSALPLPSGRPRAVPPLEDSLTSHHVANFRSIRPSPAVHPWNGIRSMHRWGCAVLLGRPCLTYC